MVFRIVTPGSTVLFQTFRRKLLLQFPVQSPWKSNQHIPPKQQKVPITIHSVWRQRTTILTSVVTTWRLLSFMIVPVFYVHMTNIVINSFWIRPIDAQIQMYFGNTSLHISGSLPAHHQELSTVKRHWHILCRFDDLLLCKQEVVKPARNM